MKINCAHDALVSVEKLKQIVNPKNPNKHPDDQIQILSKIIEFQGQRSPIVVSNRSGFITKGHGRLMAISVLGWLEAAVDYQDYESEAQEYADMIADNKIAELAQHDDKMMIEALRDMNFDLDFELLGMADFKLPELFDPKTDDDHMPDSAPPVCQPGDVWQLGRHRLMCGDATKRENVDLLMNGQQAALVITDPPYNVGVNADERGEEYDRSRPRNRRKDGATIMNDKMSDDDFKTFLKAVFDNYYAILLEGGAIYVFYADSMTVPFMTTFMDAGFHFAQNCIWNKQQFVMTRKDYHYKHEPVMYGWKKGKAHSWMSDRKQSSVWNFDRPFKSELHPTMKPINLIEYPLQNSSSIGSLVVDLFGGSGSTLIACEKTGRSCYTMELDPKYADVIIERWKQYTGGEPKKIV